MPGLMRGRWSLLTAVVRGRRVRRSGREQLQAGTSALLYPYGVGLWCFCAIYSRRSYALPRFSVVGYFQINQSLFGIFRILHTYTFVVVGGLALYP